MPSIDDMLAPVSAESPCGEDLFFSPEFDAITQARIADDPDLDQGVWATRCREADWEFVVRRSAELLATRSKDLRLAVWLAEGTVRMGDMHGFGDACHALAGLCERYWEQLHPLAEEDQEQRIGNLAWMAQRSVQWLGSLPGELSRRSDYFDQLTHAHAAIERLEDVVIGILGMDAPSFAEAKAMLSGMIDSAAPVTDDGAVHAPCGKMAPQGIPRGRSDALASLRQVAAYFRQNEPHSPVGYLADKAADWGEMPLHVWLRAVVKQGVGIGELEELLGSVGKE